jgi:hypothetical protein
VGAEGRFDGREFADHVVEGLAARQPEAGVPTPHVDQNRHHAGAGQIDGLGDVRPRGQRALNFDTGAPTPMCPPRDREHDPADEQRDGQRRLGRTDGDSGSQPRAGHEGHGGGVDPLGQPGQPETTAEQEQGAGRRSGGAQHVRPPVRTYDVDDEPGEHHRGSESERSEFGPVPPQCTEEQHHYEVGELVAGVDDHHWL